MNPTDSTPAARIRRAALLALATAALLSACGGGAKPQAAAPDKPLLVAPEDLRTVQPSTVSTGPVVNGSLQPERRADLRAEIQAVVLQVVRDNGEPVRRGELLVRLDDSALRESLASAEESVRAATRTAEQAERVVERLRTLQAQGMTSMQALEDAEVRRNVAQSELVAARSRVSNAQQQLQRTRVVAPFDGVVSERRVSAGDTVQVGRELLKVIDPATMRFEGLISADRMAEVRVGQPVAFRVNGFGDDEFAGKVRRIDATANATTRQVAVVVAFDKPAAAPRVAGLFAEGRIETGGRDVLMLPEASLQRSGDSAAVWRVEGEVLRRVNVQLGERDARRGEFPIVAGLQAGDRVLRAPVGALRDGQKVEMTASAGRNGGALPGAAAAAPAPVAR
jgi:RND family efflux transporter MFP subunit